MTIDQVLARFQGVQPSGVGWKALCPAHVDTNPSLSIARGNSGKILLHCHAGCPLENILSRSRLTLADLFPDGHDMRAATRAAIAAERDGHEPRRIVATYDYHDETGTLLHQTIRYEPKKFSQRRPDGHGGWIWGLGATRRVLYRLRELKGQRLVFIVEGEKDVDRLWSVRLSATTCVEGAGKWREEYTEQLKAAGVGQVVILPDNDKVGGDHAVSVARSCLQAGLRVKIVDLDGLPNKGDVSDWLDGGHTREELWGLARRAPWKQLADLPAPGTLMPDYEALANIEAREVDWVWPRRLARGVMTLLAGDPGQGKSFTALDIAARITKGEVWPSGGRAPLGNVVILSAEDAPEFVIRKRFDRLGGDPTRVFILKGAVRQGVPEWFSLQEHLPALEKLIHEVKPVLVIVDPISAYLGEGADGNNGPEVRRILGPLTTLIQTTNTALLAIVHLTKDSQKRALYRAQGNIAWVAAARIVLALAADPNRPDRRLLLPIKSNLSEPADVLAFTFEAGMPRWEMGPVRDVDVETVIAGPKTPGDATALEEAKQFLQTLLANGVEVASDDVFEQAHQAGISRASLNRAKKGLVRVSKSGFGTEGEWRWSLLSTAPKDTQIPHRGKFEHLRTGSQAQPTEKSIFSPKMLKPDSAPKDAQVVCEGAHEHLREHLSQPSPATSKPNRQPVKRREPVAIPSQPVRPQRQPVPIP